MIVDGSPYVPMMLPIPRRDLAHVQINPVREYYQDRMSQLDLQQSKGQNSHPIARLKHLSPSSPEAIWSTGPSTHVDRPLVKRISQRCTAREVLPVKLSVKNFQLNIGAKDFVPAHLLSDDSLDLRGILGMSGAD